MKVFKAIPVCGISILSESENDFLKFNLDDEKYYFNSVIVSKDYFKNTYPDDGLEFYNTFKSDKYDSVIIYRSLRNNSKEINNIKCMLAVIYFANRWLTQYIESESREIFINTSDNFYIDKAQNIEPMRVRMKIGLNPADNDSYNESIYRLYGSDLDSEYEGYNRYLSLFHYRNQNLTIEANDNLINKISQICKKLNDGSDYSKKMISAFRLYFDTIPEYDIEKNIINYATIFETLLLGKDEDNQRKKVSVRTACLLCDELGLEEKQYLTEIIYQFYSYRNKVIHDGYSYLDLGDDIFISRFFNCIKNIIYFLIKKIIIKDIKNIKDIKDIVKKNMKIDELENSFDYIPSDTNINKVITSIISLDYYEFKYPKSKEEIKEYYRKFYKVE